MGNHLDQFAAGCRMALDHGAELVLFDPRGAASTPAGIGQVLARPIRFARPAEMVRFGRLLYGVPLQHTVDGLCSRAMAPRLHRGDHRLVVREQELVRPTGSTPQSWDSSLPSSSQPSSGRDG